MNLKKICYNLELNLMGINPIIIRIIIMSLSIIFSTVFSCNTLAHMEDNSSKEIPATFNEKYLWWWDTKIAIVIVIVVIVVATAVVHDMDKQYKALIQEQMELDNWVYQQDMREIKIKCLSDGYFTGYGDGVHSVEQKDIPHNLRHYPPILSSDLHGEEESKEILEKLRCSCGIVESINVDALCS